MVPRYPFATLVFYLPVWFRFLPLTTLADLFVPVVAGIAFYFVIFLIARLLFLQSKKSHDNLILLLVLVGAIGVAMTLHPYSDYRPKRLHLQHMVREFHEDGKLVKYDSGYWWAPFDYIGMDDLHEDFLFLPAQDPSNTKIDACEGIYCNLPFWIPLRDYSMVESMWYIPADRPVFKGDTRLEVRSSVYNPETKIRRIECTLHGTTHMNLYFFLEPENHSLLHAWSLGVVPTHRRDVFFVLIVSGHEVSTFDFWVELRGDGKGLSVAFASHDMLPQIDEQVAAFRDDLPEYGDLVIMNSYWASHHLL